MRKMEWFLIVSAIVVCSTDAKHISRIYGGQNATSGQFPFMVALNDEYGLFCNGVIIAPNWILTTAYCLFYTSPSSEVYAGSHINQINGSAYRFFERVTHEEYDHIFLKNDIALIRINTDLEYGDTVQAVELGGVPEVNSTCSIMGWGATETQDYPPLQYVETTTIDLTTCRDLAAGSIEFYYLGPEQICIKSDTGKGACYYDYGGALICDGKLSGIYSYSFFFDCGMGMPDVYTSIEAYSDWILSYVQI